jgi:sugar (pentulose or hexulose) kinase
MNPTYYLACDLGAESGRVMVGRLEDGRLTLEEIHRFPSAAVRVLGSLRWDVLRIFEELKIGLRKVAGLRLPVASLSVDSWGVDYVLLNAVHPSPRRFIIATRDDFIAPKGWFGSAKTWPRGPNIELQKRLHFAFDSPALVPKVGNTVRFQCT